MNDFETRLVDRVNHGDIQGIAAVVNEVSLVLGQPAFNGTLGSLAQVICRFMSEADFQDEVSCDLPLPGGEVTLVFMKRGNKLLFFPDPESFPKIRTKWKANAFTTNEWLTISRWESAVAE